MSIYTVHARISEIQMMAPRASSGTIRSSEDFHALLKDAMSGPSSVNVAQAMGIAAARTTTEPVAQQSSSPQPMVVLSVQSALGSVEVNSAWGIKAAPDNSAAPEAVQYSVPSEVAEPTSKWNGSGTWTGEVDTSDGMLEKAAPYMDLINEASSIYSVPVNVIMAVIKAESDYNPRCRSHSGAMGLMQIMPCNCEYFGVTDPYDARQNIMCGTEEISRHLKSYNGDLKLALAAYNTGPGNVARRGVTSSSSAEYNRIPASVRAYADRVMRYAGLTS